MSGTSLELGGQTTPETTKRPCDFCGPVDTTEPATLEIFDDEGTLVERRTFDVCPDHVEYLIRVVKAGEN